MRQRNGTDPREETEADLKPETEKESRQLVVAFVFFLQVTVIGTTGREEEQKLSRTHHFPANRGCAWSDAPPVTVARGSTRRRCSDDTKAVQHCSRGFLCVFCVTFR